MKKVKMQRVKITREPNPKGETILRIKARSNGKIFEFGAREEAYLDDVQRASIDAVILKRLRKEQAIDDLPEKERDKSKKNREKKMASLVGTDVEEDE